jgi:CubicO group peptidase (beta-lactamase class C family)
MNVEPEAAGAAMEGPQTAMLAPRWSATMRGRDATAAPLAGMGDRVAKSWNRIETWSLIGVAGLAVLGTAMLGLHLYMTTTATPLHPDAGAVPATGTTPAAPWADAAARARQALRAGVAQRNLPGLSAAVGVDGQLVWAEGFGFADLEKRTPVSPQTRFRIGTASIPLTSAGVARLVDEGKLTLDDPIQASVPEFPKKPWPVTLRDVMGHVAGIVSDGGDEGPLLGTHCDRPADGVKAFAGDTLLFEPRTRYRFSRYDWILVSAAVEAAAGEPFDHFMTAQIFEPLDMHDTRVDPDVDARSSGRATSYFPRYAANPRYGPDEMRPLDYSCYAGSSAFVSTPSDLVRFAQGVERGNVLKPATLDLLRTPLRLASGQGTGYGLGWDLETVTLNGKSMPAVGHDGDILAGDVASLLVVRDRRLVVAVTSNTSYADTAALARTVADAFAAPVSAAAKAR